ncbi:unnamed protein product [Symbiodinium pilosum]|uniref:GH18 domain-containing protein n=1 Tax=Symbiodinium pilosum TaxID=2952 RepID=A0A812K669_SYMPI|nr:unnamed protein product [Symbiodinium pilosum]
MGKADASNIDFDMEGIMQMKYKEAAGLCNDLRTTYGHDIKCQATCLTGDDDRKTAAVYKDTFDYFAIMIHGGSMSDGWSIPVDDPFSGATWKVINEWLHAGIPASKLILAVTTNGLEAYMVNWLKAIIQKYGMAGMSVWQLKDLKSSISYQCIEDPSTQCGHPSPSTEVDGECCDPDSVTKIGSCKELGQDGCCGGAGGSALCQKV